MYAIRSYYVPTIFISYTGELLDLKAPLLKALSAVDKAATNVCHYFDSNVKKVYSYLGWEQEYFLVDEGFRITSYNVCYTKLLRLYIYILLNCNFFAIKYFNLNIMKKYDKHNLK